MLAERVSATNFDDELEVISVLDRVIGAVYRREYVSKTADVGGDRKRAAEIMRELADELEGDE